MYKTKQKKKKESKTIKGGYVSSLTGINQSERAEIFKLNRRGAGIFENKKRNKMLKPKHKNSNKDYCDSCVYFFMYKFYFNQIESYIK